MQNSKSILSIPLLLVCGYCTLGYAIFALGLLGICKSLWVFIATAIAISIFLPLIILQLKKERRSISWKTNLIIVGFFSLLYAPILLIPPYMRDDMIYHLLIPKQMVMTGRMSFDPFNINSNFPMLFKMPFVILEMFKTSISPIVINLFWTITLLLVFYSTMKKWITVSNGIVFLIVVALGTTPVIFDLLHSCYVEIFFALLITLAALFYLEVIEEESRAAWIKTCICLGLSAAVKYPGVLFIGFFCAWEFFRSKDRKLYYFGFLITILLAAPWYIKNTFWTGNPVFPLANTLFPSAYLSATRAQGFHHMLVDYNMGHSFMDLIKLPFRLALGIDESRPGMGLGFDGKLSLLFGVAVLGLGWKEKGQRFISLLFLFYFSVWTIESQ